MKQTLLILFSVVCSYAYSQTFYMCSGTNSTNALSGTLYDSGGPNGNYSNNQSCYFLIGAPCQGNLQLSFSYFSTEQGYDYIAIYDGNTTSAPLLGSYWGTGNIPTLTATSGSILVYFYSDGSATYGGFAAHWQFMGGGCAPVANFNTQVNSCQGRVNFNNTSTQNPTSFVWNFGDGNGSTLQNPVHTYSAQGTYSVTLVATNQHGSHTVTKPVTVNPMVFSIGFNGQPLANSLLTFTTNNTTGQVYTWVFGDGNVAGTVNANHTYTATGTYTAQLTITSGTCVNTQTLLVQLNDGVGISELSQPSLLAQLQPNPMQNGGTLQLTKVKPSSMRISVVNQLGQEVRVLAQDRFDAGFHTIDIGKLPAGLYFVKVQDGTATQSLRLVALD